MIEGVVAQAKYLQEQKLKQIESFLPKITKFHLDIVDSIKKFVCLAKENEIEGVEIKSSENLGEGVSVLLFQVDDRNLIFVMREDIYQINLIDEDLGNVAYLFFDGDSNFTPIIEILAYKNSKDETFFSVSWFSSEGKKPLTGNGILDVTAGNQAAEAVLRYFYNQSKCWNPKPTRENFSSQKSKKGKMGFLN